MIQLTITTGTSTLVPVIVVSCIIDHYCLRFARVLVPVVMVSCIIDHYCLRMIQLTIATGTSTLANLKQ
jgi:hypothetical protein